MNKGYTAKVCDAEVQLNDGEIITLTITASLGISRYLAEDSQRTGFLTLFNGQETTSIPIANIRMFKLTNERAIKEQPA